MRSWRHLSRFAAAAALAVTAPGTYLIYNTTKHPARARGSPPEEANGSHLLYKPSDLRWDTNWDKCETVAKKRRKEDGAVEEESKEIKPTAVRHLIFIRHGQYNLDGRDDSEKGLTELGRLQAKQTGERLKELKFKYTKLVCSTLKRAVETADIVSQSLPDVPRETCCMLAEGAPAIPDPGSSIWKPEKKQFFRDGPLIEAAFRKYFHRADVEQVGDSVEIYVCHANVIRYFVCRALQFPPEGWLRMSTNHCGITCITIKPNGRVCLKSFGDTGHLPPTNITSS